MSLAAALQVTPGAVLVRSPGRRVMHLAETAQLLAGATSRPRLRGSTRPLCRAPYGTWHLSERPGRRLCGTCARLVQARLTDRLSGPPVPNREVLLQLVHAWSDPHGIDRLVLTVTREHPTDVELRRAVGLARSRCGARQPVPARHPLGRGTRGWRQQPRSAA